MRGAWGLTLVGGAVVVLAIYVFWPSAADGDRAEAPFAGPVPHRFILTAAGLVQEADLDAGQVLVNGLRRPVDRQRAAAVWRALASCTSHTVLQGTPASQWTSYGIDGSQRLSAGPPENRLDFAWGTKGGRLWIAAGHSQRLYALSAEAGARLDKACGRLDHPGLMPPAPARGLSTGGLTLGLDPDGHWRSRSQPERPPFTCRVEALLGSLTSLRLHDLTAQRLPEQGMALAIRLDFGEAAAPCQLAFAGRDGTWCCSADGGPAQVLDPGTYDRIQSQAATLAEDRLFNIPQGRFGAWSDRIEVFRGSRRWFGLSRQGQEDQVATVSGWNLDWEGGSERAQPDCGQRIEAALNAWEVRDPRPRPQVRAAPPTEGSEEAITLVLTSDLVRTWVRYDRSQVESERHLATVTTPPPLLADLTPDRFLDPHLAAVEIERLVKIQRRIGPTHGDLLRRHERGWELLRFPSTSQAPQAVDAAAVERLTRLLTVYPSRAQRLATAADRTRAAEREIDLRIAPRTQTPFVALRDLEDSIQRDIAFLLSRDAGAWQALDPQAGVVHVLEDDMVEALFSPLSSRLVLPLAVWAVRTVTITRGADRYTLTADGEAWRLRRTDMTAVVAETTAVRAYLRFLARLEWIRARNDERPLRDGDALLGSLDCAVDEAGSIRVLRLLIAAAGETGLVCSLVGAESGSAPGRMELPQASLERLLPPAERLAQETR